MAGAISKVCLSLCIIIWNNVVGVTIIKQDPDAEREKGQNTPFMADHGSSCTFWSLYEDMAAALWVKRVQGRR